MTLPDIPRISRWNALREQLHREIDRARLGDHAALRRARDIIAMMSVV